MNDVAYERSDLKSIRGKLIRVRCHVIGMKREAQPMDLLTLPQGANLQSTHKRTDSRRQEFSDEPGGVDLSAAFRPRFKFLYLRFCLYLAAFLSNTCAFHHWNEIQGSTG
jgi:hypothetical protein